MRPMPDRLQDTGGPAILFWKEDLFNLNSVPIIFVPVLAAMGYHRSCKEESTMAMLLKRLSRLEAQMDNAIEKFLFHHHVWGFLMIFIGIPLITLTAVCLFTAAIVFPLGVFSGLI